MGAYVYCLLRLLYIIINLVKKQFAILVCIRFIFDFEQKLWCIPLILILESLHISTQEEVMPIKAGSRLNILTTTPSARHLVR